ncbi:MAG: flagellar hook-associated protein FlgK [Methylobacterium sp.]
MTLSSALNTAKSSLIATQTQTALVSRNVANVNDPGATRKYANVVTGPDGRVEVRSVAQSQNSVLFRNMLESTSALNTSSAVLNGLDRLNETIGDTDGNGSPAALLNKMTNALKDLAVSPNNVNFASAAVSSAQDLAKSLNDLTTTVGVIRRDADDSLVVAAEDMNKILARIQDLNEKVTSGTRGNIDVTDFVDQRDHAVAELSIYVGVSAQIRGDNDLVLHTDSGVTLFDKIARPVEYTATSPLTAGVVGNAFKIDGTVVTGPNAYMPARDGRIAGLVELRDKTAVAFQAQLDKTAEGLIGAFEEKLVVNPPATETPKTGLFTAPNGANGLVDKAPGLAGRLSISAAAIKNPFLVRDGGINDDDANAATASRYVSNTTGAAGFTGRINDLIGKLETKSTQSTDSLTSTGTLADFASDSMSWLQSLRSAKSSETTYKQTLVDKTKETLSNETGINLETELTMLLDLQRSFQASSKLISTVDQMMAALLQSV